MRLMRENTQTRGRQKGKYDGETRSYSVHIQAVFITHTQSLAGIIALTVALKILKSRRHLSGSAYSAPISSKDSHRDGIKQQIEADRGRSRTIAHGSLRRWLVWDETSLTCSPLLDQSSSFFRYFFMTDATSSPSLPSASSLSP